MINKVAINKCDNYNVTDIADILIKQINGLNINLDDFNGKNVLIKPNLLMRVTPDKAVTTNPAVVEAICKILIQHGANVTIADSPGGVYTPFILKSLYKTCGMTDAAERTGAVLNYDTSFKEIHNPNGHTSKMFNFLTPVCEADYIINVCKLKTHMFTIMSAAVKNLFGCVPGVQKFEMHARFKEHQKFYSMIVDLCKAVCDLKPVLNIVDAVTGMEGNGPSGGSPRNIGCIVMSENPFAADMVNAELLGLGNNVPTVEIAKQRKLCPKSIDDIEIIGDDLNKFVISDFKKPETVLSNAFDLIPSFLKPRPVVDRKKCVACLDCIKSCPVNTIILNKNNKAFIISRDCIKCYCCQELCKFKAIKIKKNFIYKIIK